MFVFIVTMWNVLSGCVHIDMSHESEFRSLVVSYLYELRGAFTVINKHKAICNLVAINVRRNCLTNVIAERRNAVCLLLSYAEWVLYTFLLL